ncbi:MAG: hypothetical protein IKH65_00005, partial [Clostridia bacterium]|nr:hypothetical protein [Clostridia bacterium]
MKKTFRKYLALLLTLTMIMSGGVGTMITAFADDNIPVTVIKYWEDLGWNGGQPSTQPQDINLVWHDSSSSQTGVVLSGSNNYRATTTWSSGFINQ